jgi:hypothetical protein
VNTVNKDFLPGVPPFELRLPALQLN